MCLKTRVCSLVHFSSAEMSSTLVCARSSACRSTHDSSAWILDTFVPLRSSTRRCLSFTLNSVDRFRMMSSRHESFMCFGWHPCRTWMWVSDLNGFSALLLIHRIFDEYSYDNSDNSLEHSRSSLNDTYSLMRRHRSRILSTLMRGMVYDLLNDSRALISFVVSICFKYCECLFPGL